MSSSRIKPGGKVFRDPIHRLIRIDKADEFILDLIDTPEFQRLRRIRQLGVSWLTFHGAEHSRFVHSLGVFNFAQRILEVLCRRYAGDDVARYLQEHAQVVKAAALLHDIGHGPFSHMIERAIGAGGQHEKKTVSLIRDCESSIGKALVDHKINAEEVARIIEHTSEHSLLTDIVSSQLDADRMDYLLRDSYSTGVQYGVYDVEWILNAMCVGLDRDAKTGDTPTGRWRLCLDKRRGEKAAEQFVLARSHMNEQVYFHRVTRGYETMLLALFEEVARVSSTGSLPEGTPEVVADFIKSRGKLDREEWLRLDEAQLVVAMHAWARATGEEHRSVARWSRAFISRERLLLAVPMDMRALGSNTVLDLYKNLQNSGLRQGIHWMIDDVSLTAYKGIFSTAAKDAEESRSESILIASGHPKKPAQPIESNSDLLKDLDKRKQSLTRLFVDRDVFDRAQPVLKQYKLGHESTGDEE